MLEGLVAWVLNNYLGKYVENLNTDQLSIAMLSGEVELENLPLKKDALRHLNLPIEIKTGFIGKVKLQIPVRQIRSAPWVIVIEQLYVVISPIDLDEWDSVAEEATAQEFKLSALDAIEARWRFETDSKHTATYYSSTYSSWLNFGTGLITDVMENLQLIIRDVHIRYEDTINITNRAVSFGITMDYLSAQSCDSTWVPGFSHWESSTESFKLLEMHQLSIYWLETTQLYSKMTLNELKTAMSPLNSSNYSDSYILSPVSAQAHLKRNRSEQPLRSFDTPRIVCDLHLQEVPLILVDCQYEQMVNCLRGIHTTSFLRNFRKHRPNCSVSSDPKAWWIYAISCEFSNKLPSFCKPKPTWESCLERAKQNVEYVKLYTKVLSTPATALSIECKKVKDLIEWNQTYEELKVLREIAMRLVPNQNCKSNNGSSTGRSVLVSWFPQWMGWYSQTASETSNTSSSTTQLEGEILEALQDSVENNSLLKRDVIFGQFNFSLNSGTLSLCTSKSNSNFCLPMFELQFKNLSLNVVSRPRSSSYLIELSLGALYLRDKLTLNSLFPILVGPPGHDRITQLNKSRGSSTKLKNFDESSDSLFYLAYERRSESTLSDYRLQVCSKSLDVVYQPAAVKWLTEFFCLPNQRIITQRRIEAVKLRTKQELMKNWEQILSGHSGRKNWELQLDISAPQIIFVEQFGDMNAAMAVIDFGRFQLHNVQNKFIIPIITAKESEEDDMFMTPCSTPPGSMEASISESISVAPENLNTVNEENLHHKLYDQYCVELTDLQILIGRVKDNWRYAHNRGSSSLHVLDRFNISLQIEHRVVHTCDPLYPSLVVNANLPKLIAHINEQKIAHARGLLEVIRLTGLPSPFNTPDVDTPELVTMPINEDEESISVDVSMEMSKLLLFQFTVEQLALEVQSRGRSIAELQVSGVKASFSKRPIDVSITLSVHSLLLVDALQTFGRDFELLVASHKHVGMDSMSGSIRDSEPTSPTSPGSPEPLIQTMGTSPIALTQALNTLSSSPIPLRVPVLLDSETLISIEVILINGPEPIHLANIQFNNLDIIANQETIVELIGFTQRVFPELNRQKQTGNSLNLEPTSQDVNENLKREEMLANSKVCRMELTFDFRRLNVLILRGIVKDDCVYGRKIATATMSEAKIRATVDNSVTVEGSLGGLQVLDLTPEGHFHQRIISVGHDPFVEVAHSLYSMSHNVNSDDRKAFSFKVTRNLHNSSDADDVAVVTIRMASVWYTHSPQFLVEIQSCATEFKQYLANLARSIRSAATDMALGLVQVRAEALAQSLYINSRLSSSLYGSALSLSDMVSPRRRSRHSSFVDHGDFQSGYSSTRDTVSQTPYTPVDDDNFVIDMKLDIVLDSPVIVLPRAANSNQVFVAHLGKTTVNNNNNQTDNYNDFVKRSELYNIEIRDMNLFSLDTTSRRVPGLLMNKPEILYCCETLAKPILHNTVVQLTVLREIFCNLQSRHHSLSNLLDDDTSPNLEDCSFQSTENVQISGSVVTALKVSLTRSQYEQLLDTFYSMTTKPSVSNVYVGTRMNSKGLSNLGDISEEDTGVTTLKMDPHVRAKLFPTISIAKPKSNLKRNICLKAIFELPVFIIELKGDSPQGEQCFVDLSFQDFAFNYENSHQYETNIQVSLRSFVMEDLLQPLNSRHRDMVVSSAIEPFPSASSCLSRSCPDIHAQFSSSGQVHGSLPDHLEPSGILGMGSSNVASNRSQNYMYPSTPPPSPTSKQNHEKNLVLISSLIVDSDAPNFKSYYNSVNRSTSIDFNCLDLAISVESWVVVLDFFSAYSPETQNANSSDAAISKEDYTDREAVENAETNITVQSLTVTLIRLEREIAKANVSFVDLVIKTNGLHKEVEGSLGCMSLIDLTSQGQLYKERFLTSGKQALHFNYVRFSPNEMPDFDAQLKLKMSSILYVHTKRFVVELQAFFYHFTQLLSVMRSIRAAASSQKYKEDYKRLSLLLQAEAPVILLPVNLKRSDVLIADLGQLNLTNCFKESGDKDTISLVNSSTSDKKCLLDVMSVYLQNVDLYCGIRLGDYDDEALKTDNLGCFKFGTYKINKVGPSLLTEKCHLKIKIEHNLDKNFYHTVPDMSIHGELSTLDAALDFHQYQIIKNLLIYNLGENTEHILSSVSSAVNVSAKSGIREVWTLSSLKLDLLNVILRLQIQHDKLPLAKVNFIKSRLTIETFSNLSQDVDLVSQEILLIDTRFKETSLERKSNIFTNILQPITALRQNDIVQAEIHSRRRQDRTKFTILLNNMRLMAVFDWWNSALKFILESPSDVINFECEDDALENKLGEQTEIPFELKLNITDSEIVVVEDTSQWDTNAVIFKSTTVLSYKPYAVEKPLSCNLNNCEMYSCILGIEEETALSIIDPVTLNMEINKNQTLEVQLQTLTVRLSYYDLKMFLKILNSLPQQMFSNKTEANTQSDEMKSKLSKLMTLGFLPDDCTKALNVCDEKLDDAALWLTQNAIPSPKNYNSRRQLRKTSIAVSAVEIKADCLCLCLIDDCGDSDVPLLEVSLVQLNLRQRIGSVDPSEEEVAPVEGALECKLTCDYYNRWLSGWEPIVEPWKCVIVWDHVLTTNLTKNRLQLNIESHDYLNVNITSSLAELYKQTRDSWTQDYYGNNVGIGKDLTSPGYRRRSPFVPFALKNESGLPLYFTTVISDMDLSFYSEESMEVTDSWISVSPGKTVPFSFRSRDKRRHGDSHRLRMHQLGVKLDGWKPVYPVTIDKVGTYFRHTSADIQHRTENVPYARIVFDVALEGSARKLVTVRSSLLIVNKLQEDMEVKLENVNETANSSWMFTKCILLSKNATLPVPLTHVYSQISVRPIHANKVYTFCNPYIYWAKIPIPLDHVAELRSCHMPRDSLIYRFCAKVKRENYHVEKSIGIVGPIGQAKQPAHTITLLPAILLVNLLPTDLNFNLFDDSGRVSPGSRMPITSVDAEQMIELKLSLENFPVSSTLVVPAGFINSFSCRVRIQDTAGRRLFLQAVVVPHNEARIKITISAPYWIINKTGLPLVFKQRGVNLDTAGQFEEHEIARMVAPLLFSFSDPDAGPSVVARIGSAAIPQGNAQWSDSFDLQRGIKVRKLTVNFKDGRRDVVFLFGIEVRTGRGQYRHTNIITLSPRYQLYNKSSYRLLFSQSCFATTVADPEAEVTYLEVVPDCHIPFNWQRLDKEQLLCVLIRDIPSSCWSGGFKIDKNDSMHLNIRDIDYHMYFLRLEVVLQRATFFVVFTDADKMPPPIRIDNFSEVSITFAQSCCKDTTRSIARAHTSVPFAWDQPTRPFALNIVAPGGVTNTYDMNKLGNSTGLTYENFIYIAFTGTFKNGEEILDPLDVESQQLVLDIVQGSKVVLSRKQPGQRSQLWRMTTTGQLQHEGSSPPSYPQYPRSENTMVLDIEGPAPQPTSYTRLVLRRPDLRRRSTQTWRFTEEGRLCCAHYNMCVQAQDGFFGLRQGNAVVLGLPQLICHRKTKSGIPLEQAVTRQRLRPGSGFLSAEILTDGPTRVLVIRDMKEQQIIASASKEQRYDSIVQSKIVAEKIEIVKEMQFTIRLAGLSISLISRRPSEELLFARFTTIVSETILTSSAKTFCISVKDVQCDNQLFDTSVPVVLYVTSPVTRDSDEAQHKLPALEVSVDIQPKLNNNTVIFRHLMVRLKKLTINLEEKLILKLCLFFKAGSQVDELWNNVDESDFEAQRMLMEVSAAHAKRYYFGVIQLVPDQIKLSMKTANKLSPQLQIIKRKLGFTFIKFEDASVDLEPFIRRHMFETSQIINHSLIKHFKDELVWQAGRILGSTDFLGNPLGLMNDVSEGVSSLIHDGSVGALVKNVTHGLSNSAAKVTESLSDGLGRVSMDDEHEEMRLKIRTVDSGRSGDHIVAGIKGLGFGILGGATGIFKQVYEGATNEGIQGVFSGFGKGVLGAVTKPVVGVLDLASETARAVRDSSRSSNRVLPNRIRPPRCVVGPGGLLPCYSKKQSQGQQYLLLVDNKSYSERLVAYEYLRTGTEDLRIVISNEKVRIITGSNHSLNTVIETHLSDLLQCQPVTLTEGFEIRHYIELTMRVAGSSAVLAYQDPIKKPRIRCDSMELAHSVSQQLSYAKRLYNDGIHTVGTDGSQNED